MITTHRQKWERILSSRAYEARRSAVSAAPIPLSDETLLRRAYAYCDAVIAEHSHTFYIASKLLPAAERRAIRALYAFCRLTDDIVDRPNSDPDAVLAAWRERIVCGRYPKDDLVAVAWADTRLRYKIPCGYAMQLIDGIERDLHQNRYSTFEDLATYAYGVASTVGLMSMYIIGLRPGVSETQAVPYMIKLGLALQLTNILRDVGEDWRTGRLYLPTEDLAVCGLSEQDVASGVVNDRWRAFMYFQVERNRDLYREAWPGVLMFNEGGRFAVAAAAGLYSAILDDIEAHDFDVFHRRAHVGTFGKVRRLPGIWWRSNHGHGLAASRR